MEEGVLPGGGVALTCYQLSQGSSTPPDAVPIPTSNFDQGIISISIKLCSFTYRACTILCTAGEQCVSGLR
jgi:hypothetical protein